MKIHSHRILLAVALWCCVTAYSETTTQQPAANINWSLQECIDYALQHNLDLLQKEVQVNISDVDISSKQGALFPSLSFATNQNVSWRPWSQSYVNITDGSMTSTTSTVNYNGTYGVQAQWTVWNGGINRKQLQLSRMSKQRSETDVESTRLSLKERIATLYVQILYQTEGVEVCRNILSSTRTQLDQAQAMYDVGSMSRADLAQVEAQVSQEEYNVANALTQLADFKMQLRQLLELPADCDFGVAAAQIDDESVLRLLPAVAEVYAVAANQRPEIRYSQIGIEMADLDIDIAKRGRYPTVSIQGGINTSATSGMDFSWANQLKTNLSNSLGLTVSVPIFDNRQASTNIARARFDKETAEISLEQQRRQLYNSIETLWLNASNAQSQFKYAVSNVKSMRESYSLVNEQFEVGLKNIVDLITSKNNLVQAEQQMLQSKYTAVLNRALLNFYNGESLTLK